MEENTFTDPRDGKVYKTVKIGRQVWMAENLAYDTPDSKYYKDDENNGKKYGRLYNWETAMKVCPHGWHLPSKEEWQTLVDFAGGEEIAGKKLKAKRDWRASGIGTDDFGFSALPSGRYHALSGGVSLYEGFCVSCCCGGWWSSERYVALEMGYDTDHFGYCNVESSDEDDLSFGTLAYCQRKAYEKKYYSYLRNTFYSIRCLQDDNKHLVDPRDGKEYKTVKIGEQIWMAENLAYDVKGSKCYDEKYGRLYNWESALKACPEGWHLPSREEWQVLVKSAGGEKVAGKKLKAKSENGTDDFGFSALLSGYGYSDGSIDHIGKFGNYWTSSDSEHTGYAYGRYIGSDYENFLWDYSNKTRLFSVRCVKDGWGAAKEQKRIMLSDPQMCLEAVKKKGRALISVPEELKTAELCNIAVNQDGFALEFVPEKLKTAELCLKAVKYCGHTLCYVPEELKTLELCIEAVKQNSSAIKYVPETFLSSLYARIS
ncbi:MAG: DUF4116 domain-containing protein [Fibromonadaceae bacterium]|jgi:uncharacterized protein (TIGR02145 family)|nr:DUF4116 domain-containing protein [Fibromonadaceae bacterium]